MACPPGDGSRGTGRRNAKQRVQRNPDTGLSIRSPGASKRPEVQPPSQGEPGGAGRATEPPSPGRSLGDAARGARSSGSSGGYAVRSPRRPPRSSVQRRSDRLVTDRGTCEEEPAMNDQEWDEVGEIFESRGVSRKVADARPYQPCRRGEAWVYSGAQLWIGGRCIVGPFNTIPATQRAVTITRDVRGADGLVMYKHPVPLSNRKLMEFPPQLRPTL